MSIKIEQDTCIGCGRCGEVCPGNLIVLAAGKAQIREVRDCWGCTACVKECPVNAIGYYLGADMGGNGSLLYVKDTGDTLEWVIEKVDGQTETIIIDKSKSNAY